MLDIVAVLFSAVNWDRFNVRPFTFLKEELS